MCSALRSPKRIHVLRVTACVVAVLWPCPQERLWNEAGALQENLVLIRILCAELTAGGSGPDVTGSWVRPSHSATFAHLLRSDAPKPLTQISHPSPGRQTFHNFPTARSGASAEPRRFTGLQPADALRL